ncbi:hypothetical protein OZN62_13610 [Aurantiacibacter sp. MUD11]|uniref:hypothetical protein n=1 Tax=Aurantiacibacter sp. MUD11 TaxID=3003265 RepID=UPI0022AB1158|nr:hypothetical protein [Aurantiacibacter sp. MUD11]WAT17933.1 hypothetical protein OZN62_13610 [Aurantiacibacter sp. MUD11]
MEALLIEYRAYIQYLIIFSLTAYAFWRGDGPEKEAGAILSGMVAMDVGYHLLLPESGVYSEVDLGHLVIDLLVLILLGRLAVRANRIYPLWMLAGQIISTLMHFNRELSPTLDPIAYLVLTRMPSYLQIMALGVGLVAHRVRVHRYGTYRSWRNS